MSTKSSLAYVEIKETKEIHVYKDTLDDLHYLETEKGRLEIPAKVAEAIAVVLNENFGGAQ